VNDADRLEHLIQACKAILRVCHGRTPGGPVDDLAQCANLAEQGMKGQPLVGDPGVYKLSRIKED
jgi:hypothetical protein